MAKYVVLINWTEQGIRNVKDTVQRAQQFRSDAERRGVKVVGIHWTEGRYDIVTLLESDNEQAVMTTLLNIGRQGNIRTETLRAFDESEMATFLQQL